MLERRCSSATLLKEGYVIRRIEFSKRQKVEDNVRNFERRANGGASRGIVTLLEPHRIFTSLYRRVTAAVSYPEVFVQKVDALQSYIQPLWVRAHLLLNPSYAAAFLRRNIFSLTTDHDLATLAVDSLRNPFKT